ncbi:carboxypeptidase regulatory-like domain-containing protein [Candidatus Shapirobacteria bacterium]|nr:carboxypeptidase regulatory-like domain-containing protein [Candidatus Shapirobacteria bacterium]
MIFSLLLPLTFPKATLAIDPLPTQAATLQVGATVPPRASDFQFEFASPDQPATIGPNTLLEYTLTYGSNLAFATSLNLEAEWGLGALVGQNLSAFEIVSFVPGSATAGYQGSLPIIDQAKRRITWKIDSFPKKTTNQTVSFKLKTPSRYLGDQKIGFSVQARLYTSQVSLPFKIIKQIYSPAKFLQNEYADLAGIETEIRSVDDQSFSLLVRTRQPTRATLYYGKEARLGQEASGQNLSQEKILRVAGLEKENVLISASGITLKNRSSAGTPGSVTFLPNKSLDLFLPFKVSVPVQVFVRMVPAQVLGINNLSPIPYLEKTRLLETEPNVFSGKVMMPAKPGNYELLIEALGVDGSLNQDVLAKFYLAEHLKIVDNLGSPIEKARVALEWYDKRQRLFEYFPAESFGFRNPAYSEPDGSVDVILPEGEYRLRASAIGYLPQELTFAFSPLAGQDYPKLTLVKKPFSLADFAGYYRTVLADTLRFLNYNFEKLAASYRFFNFALLIGLFLLSVISFLLTASRLKMSLEDVLLYFEKYARLFSGQKIKPAELLTGFIENRETGLPLHAAAVFLTASGKRHAYSRDITNYLGEFHLRMKPGEDFWLIAKEAGFETLKRRVTSQDLGKKPFVLSLRREPQVSGSKIMELLEVLGLGIVHTASDTLFALIFLLNILLIFRLGMDRVWPITLVTIFNFGLWAEYSWKKWQERLAS